MTDVATTHEYATVFVIRHEAGSAEGAVYQRNEMDKAVAVLGGEVVMAVTEIGDARELGFQHFRTLVDDEAD